VLGMGEDKYGCDGSTRRDMIWLRGVVVASGGSELGHNLGAPVATGAMAMTQEEEAATQGLHT
jgi:hypothetical protein